MTDTVTSQNIDLRPGTPCMKQTNDLRNFMEITEGPGGYKFTGHHRKTSWPQICWTTLRDLLAIKFFDVTERLVDYKFN
jgi:hypothetical protein